MYCDEMRIALAVPNTCIVEFKESKNWLYYYDLQELNGIFLQFITNKLKYLHSRDSDFPFVVFKDKFEKEKFIDFVKTNEDTFHKISPTYWGEHAKKEIKEQKKSFAIDPLFIDRIKQINQRWAGYNKGHNTYAGL